MMEQTPPQMSILLADDDPDFLFQTAFILEKAGFSVNRCASRKEAEEALKSGAPDLAIFDLMMEESDSGFILSYKTKQLFPSCKVIILTAVTRETCLKFSVGQDPGHNWIKADLILEKGLQAAQLLYHIKQLVH